MTKVFFNLLILVLAGVGVFLFITFTGGWEDFSKSAPFVNWWWILASFGAMVLYWLVEAIILFITIRSFYKQIGFLRVFQVTMVGQFFNVITPLATGGQPGQLWVMVRSGMHASISASILIVKFVIYQVVMVVFSIGFILFRSDFFMPYVNNLFFLVVVGFLVHFLIIAMLLVLSSFPVLTRAFLRMVAFFIKILPFKKKRDINAMRASWLDKLHQFHDSLALLAGKKGLLLALVGLTALQLFIFFGIPYIIAYGLPIPKVGDFWDMMAANCFVHMIVSIVPIPGATGGAEGGFFLFFGPFFGTSIVLGMLLWRGVTFLSSLVFGALAVFFDRGGHPLGVINGDQAAPGTETRAPDQT